MCLFPDYTQYISQVATLDSGLQGLQGLAGLQTASLPDGTTVAFIDSSVLDSSQIFDTTAIEVHQQLPARWRSSRYQNKNICFFFS